MNKGRANPSIKGTSIKTTHTKILTIVILVVLAVAAFVWYWESTTSYELHPHRPICPINMSGLAKAMLVYANDDPNGRVPSVDKWCDLLVQLDYASPKQFRCSYSDVIEPGESSYAINRNLVGKNIFDVPGDVVFLFETDFGKDPNGRNEFVKNRQYHAQMPYGNGETRVYRDRWNQSGGPEILATQRHEGKGCNVTFVNTSVKFVRTKDLAKLNWGTETNEK